jgi:hypothetical protein
MEIAIPIYDGVTALDAIEPCEPAVVRHSGMRHYQTARRPDGMRTRVVVT